MNISEASKVNQGHLKNLLFADLSLSMTTLITIFAFCLQSGKWPFVTFKFPTLTWVGTDNVYYDILRFIFSLVSSPL